MSGVMSPYVVRQGDYLAKLAFVRGFDADKVWNNPKNDDLRKLRPDPNLLAPGDILYIPEKAPEALSIASGTENNYSALVPKVPIVVVFKENDGKPLANEPCTIEGLAGAEPDAKLERSTDDEGKLQLDVPVDVRELSVHFPGRHCTFQLRVGEMDPMSEATGIRKRLRHLGYGDERLLSFLEDDACLREAVALFQEAQGLEPTGTLDDQVKELLNKAHGV